MIWNTMAAMPMAHLLTFLAGALALNIAPGPDVLFASACGMGRGPRAGALAGLGVGIGSVGHVMLAVMGLGALIAANPAALVAVQWLGAGYLVWLAWQSWNAAPRPGRDADEGSSRLIWRGMVTNLLNPKLMLFFLAFLPQFADPEFGPLWQQFLGLGLIFVTTGTLITMGYGVLAGWLGMRLGARLKVMNRVAALLFLGLAARLVAR